MRRGLPSLLTQPLTIGRWLAENRANLGKPRGKLLIDIGFDLAPKSARLSDRTATRSAVLEEPKPSMIKRLSGPSVIDGAPKKFIPAFLNSIGGRSIGYQ